MRLRISSRKSDLARIQAYQVGDALKAVHPSLEIEFHFSESLGDKNLTDPLWKMPEKGVFTEDLTRALTGGETDLVVHSWKDLPVEENPLTEIAATLPRADVRDLLLFKKSSLTKLQPGFVPAIFSSSPRREYNLRPFLKDYLPGSPADVTFTSVRGNIPTRLRKLLEDGAVDGLVVAKAALDRILTSERGEFAEAREKVREALSRCEFMVLPLSANPAAPAQGALAIEIRKDRDDVRALLQPIHRPDVFREVVRERAILKSHGGGCHQKIGATVLEREGGSLVFVRGLTTAGIELRERAWEGSAAGEAEIVRTDRLFERKRAVGKPDLTGVSALLVAHSFAWLPDLEFSGIVWTAGLSTWKKLAAAGVWVHGSTESLGEREDPRLEALRPGLQWGLLTHSRSKSSRGSRVIPTYDLVPRADAAPPEGKTLHWTSAELFDEAMKRWPELRERRQSCGLGKTKDELAVRVDSLEIRWPVSEEMERRAE